MYSDSQRQLLELLGEKEEVSLMVAPSFIVDFDYKKFVPLMKGLGFDHVAELTFGAKIVNKNYYQYIHENKEKQDCFISSTCPMCVSLIKSKYPLETKYLLPFDSPMETMTKILRKKFKGKIVFLSPCNAKKMEVGPDLIITFKEMKDLLKKEKPRPIKASHLFDRFYNDFTKIYPISGGLSKSIRKKGILRKNEICVADGPKEIKTCINSNAIFKDILFCQGGCVGGPEVNSTLPTWLRKISVKSYMKQARKEKMGPRKGLDKYSKNINFSKNFLK